MIQAIRGTKDILPDTIELWAFIESKLREVSQNFLYKEIRTPVFEKTEVFSRSIGDTTDIVNKEMYTFTDRGGTSLTLKPEMTASMVRAVIQNKLLDASQTLRLWYFAPLFRYERPQKGRLRQFHQYGAECLGTVHPEADAEILILADQLFKSLGISDYKLLLNSLGSNESRQNYKNSLVEFLDANKDKLSEDSIKRLEKNPLRILDSKNPQDKELVKDCPKILDFLDDESREHFEKVRVLLDSAGVEYIIDQKLVRGLDYYCHTVFEFQHDSLGSQDSFGGGGRYNHLFQQLEGKETPAIGFALGIERIILILESIGSLFDMMIIPDLYIVTAGSENSSEVQNLAKRLRESGIKTITDIQKRSVKAQFREANKINTKYSLVIGQNEVQTRKATLKKMSSGQELDLNIDSFSIDDFKKLT